ncbi:MAG TPA: hypothetical protein VFM99_10145 [Chitinophagales bacterium]|nr:hypothetical protein [Chitinophagales bacterium]
MPNWNEILVEIQQEIVLKNPHPIDTVRKKYLRRISENTNRNVIAYYSGWLYRNSADVAINDKDKAAFMLNIHGMDRSKGLDLILHTPGGDLAATESLVEYLHCMFGNDIRAIIPQISMSAGTMIALSCKEIMMGKQSNLGPIDPQMGNIACQGVIAEFDKAKEDIKANPQSALLWTSIIGKYHPTFLGSCQQAIDWSQKLAEEWLGRNMCASDISKVAKILKEFSDHQEQKSHSRHISLRKCKDVGLNIIDMEADNMLQDLILSAHHAYAHSFSNSTAVKVVENHLGIAYIENIPMPISNS